MNRPADHGPRRALVLAGGGLKVAFQAGVLQVLLDEASVDGEPLRFHLADGASGGVFNLAMWCQGMTGTEIANNWRAYAPRRGVQPSWGDLWRLPYARSLLRTGRLRRNVFRDWGLDFEKIRASSRPATFNLYNFTRQRLEVFTPAQMTEDHLVAAVSLPIWFPPVRIDGDLYIDAVYANDANLEEAIRRGADELWVIWTVSRRGEWHRGFVAQYFQIIEASANSQLDEVLRRIQASNAAVERGGEGEFGRLITVRMLTREVELHYLIGLDRYRFAEAVNAGVQAAREWCRELPGVTLEQAPPAPAPDGAAPTRLWFDEEMKGTLTRTGPRAAGTPASSRAVLRLRITVDDVDRFVTDPAHLADAGGQVDCAALGGRLGVERGSFNLLVDEGDPASKRMLYELVLPDGHGGRLTLRGVKQVVDDPGLDVWRDATTLQVRVFAGEPPAGADEPGEPLATGVVQVHLLDFLQQLASFRVRGPTVAAEFEALNRFGLLFFGKLWDVYAREVLTSSPL